MEGLFRNVVENIFNNWTALILAVENGMGGANSKQTVDECIDYIVQYCINEETVNISEITEVLEDILDQEFDTICEDGSPGEIATLLFKFLSLLREGNLVQFDSEFQLLPKSKICLTTTPPVPLQGASTSSFEDHNMSEGACLDNVVKEESEWTEVKSRRKR